MNLEYLQSKWNLLITAAGTIIAILAGFTDIPSYAAAALSSNANYELLAKFVLAIVIAVMLIPCAFFNKKKHRIMWGVITIVLLALSLFLYFKSVSYKKKSTVDYTSRSGGYIVKGDKLYPEKDSLWKEMEKEKKSKLSETEFIAENLEPDDSTGVLTATGLWPKEQIESNAKNIIYLYLGTVVLFALTVISAVQTVYCIAAKK